MQVQGEHSAILSTFIKLPFVIKIFVLSIFEWPFYTGITVFYYYRSSGSILFHDSKHYEHRSECSGGFRGGTLETQPHPPPPPPPHFKYPMKMNVTNLFRKNEIKSAKQTQSKPPIPLCIWPPFSEILDPPLNCTLIWVHIVRTTDYL